MVELDLWLSQLTLRRDNGHHVSFSELSMAGNNDCLMHFLGHEDLTSMWQRKMLKLVTTNIAIYV